MTRALVCDLTRLSCSTRETADYFALKGLLVAAGVDGGARLPARLDYDPKKEFQTPTKSPYLSNLTGDSQGSCEKWYPQRDSNPRSLP